MNKEQDALPKGIYSYEEVGTKHLLTYLNTIFKLKISQGFEFIYIAEILEKDFVVIKWSKEI